MSKLDEILNVHEDRARSSDELSQQEHNLTMNGILDLFDELVGADMPIPETGTEAVRMLGVNNSIGNSVRAHIRREINKLRPVEDNPS